MTMRDPVLIEVTETSAVGEVRRAVSSLAGELGLDEDATGRLSVIATELATNIVKHATRGIVLIGSDTAAVEVIALDTGPGIADIAQALRDGHSTTATSGTGLGAVSRMADFFDLYSARKLGTAVLARVAKDALKGAAEVAAISVPVRNEYVNGDGWDCVEDNGTRSVMLVDGLGHGLPAHEAALAASAAFRTAKGAPAEKLRTIHEALKRTRGAAVAIAELDAGNGTANGTMRFAGIGNISVTMIDPVARRSAVSLYGIVGHDVREFREFSYPWSRESSLIMHSDGLTTRWDLDRYPGLLSHDPALIAGMLWKDHRRQNDDSTVVVARTP
jgi:anti-sigma regulatory factor (Ser/Thr protein kinase)